MPMNVKYQSPAPAAPAKARVGLLNPAFVYRSAASTDIRQTFERIRAAQANK